ncbi:hypothetical protein OX283_002520 [Flavobacterium sp. SUN052]|uniref:hypothetical protein n=1 Tax=Flavobacterium sp. SUN052 TaxID=3002441 RepID=UPI00237EA080|nr:hypothetical protein [Flavobacterium sp. SUN052]MEC4003520.1 hypothetical protein [Flavobacterium sp. SUN052]
MSVSPKINIIFRACDKVNSAHGSPRPFGLDKKTLIKICFKSLYNSLQGYNYNIIVLGDDLSIEMKAFFLKYNVQFNEGIYGNDKSIRETIKIAEQFNDNEWVYFCEDDYLHTPETFQKIITLINERETIIPGNFRIKQLLRKREITLISIPRFFKKPEIIIHPCDYPDRYSFKFSTPNFIFHTSDCHWRQVSDTTFTFLMKAESVKKYKDKLLKASNKANDRFLSKNLFGKSLFYNKLLCLSPMPSLTSHMHDQTMSPLVNWKKLVDDLLDEI